MSFHQTKTPEILFPCILTSTTLPLSTSVKKFENGSLFFQHLFFSGLETC